MAGMILAGEVVKDLSGISDKNKNPKSENLEEEKAGNGRSRVGKRNY